MGAGRLTGIVLGAGGSRRLGRPKQTLPFGGGTLLGWVMRDVEASGLDRVVLVVGAAADEALADLRLTRAEVARNDAYGTGCASSLLAGLDAAGDCDAVVLLLGDMPGVEAKVIDAVAADWGEHRPWAAATAYRDGLGHPLVFSRAAFGELRGLHGDRAAWKLVETPSERVRHVAIDRPLPVDVDTREDYEAALARLGLGIADPAEG